MSIGAQEKVEQTGDLSVDGLACTHLNKIVSHAEMHAHLISYEM